MSLIKIITEEKSVVKRYLDEWVSFDHGLIDLYVGWDLAKSKGFSILNHQVNEKTYWIFSPLEKRKQFEDFINKLKTDVLLKIKTDKTILNIDPLLFNTQKEFLTYLKENVSNLTTYLYKEKLYVYNQNVIHHLDLGLLKFIGWDIVDEVVSILDIRTLDKGYLKYNKILDVKYIPYLINAKEDIITSHIS